MGPLHDQAMATEPFTALDALAGDARHDPARPALLPTRLGIVGLVGAQLVRPPARATAAAETMGVCPKTVGRWVSRFEADGAAGLQDRSSQPHSLHRPTPVATQEAILTLRR